MTHSRVVRLIIHKRLQSSTEGRCRGHMQEAPSCKDPLCHTIPPGHTQQRPDSPSHTHTHTGHTVTASQGPRQSSGTHMHPMQEQARLWTHLRDACWPDSPPPPSQVRSHSSHTTRPKTAWPCPLSVQRPPCRARWGPRFPPGPTYSATPTHFTGCPRAGWFRAPGSGGGIFSYN